MRGNRTTLWDRLDTILRVDQNPKHDKTGIGKMNRLAKKGFKELKKAGIDFGPENSRIEFVENVSLSALGEIELAHGDGWVVERNPPIVIIHWKGTNYVIDGTHRINYWREHDPHRTFSVLVISLNGTKSGAPQNES